MDVADNLVLHLEGEARGASGATLQKAHCVGSVIGLKVFRHQRAICGKLKEPP